MKKAVVLGIILVSLSVYVYFTEILPARAYDPQVRGTGTIEATEVVVSTKIAGRIKSIEVNEGDRVEAGQVLVTLDCEELQARLRQAEAQVAQVRAGQGQAGAARNQTKAQIQPLERQKEQAERDFERAKKLYESGTIPQNQYEKAESGLKTLKDQITAGEEAVKVAGQAVSVFDAQIKLAQTAVDLIKVSIEECTIKAPLTGLVIAKNYEVGEMALPGSSLLRIDWLDSVHTWIYVPNAEVGKVRVGQKVKLLADTYPDREFVGQVARINPKAEFTPKTIQTKEDRTRLVYGVKVELENKDGALMPGMPVEARLVDGE